MTLEGAWVAYLDAYGFSAAVDSPNRTKIDRFFVDIRDQLNKNEQRSSRSSEVAYQFSDSVFVIRQAYPNPATQLQDFIGVIEDLQRVALQYKFAFRGAIAFGEVTVEPYGCYGKPVVEAARLEPHLAMPLVILPARGILKADSFLRDKHGIPDGLGLHLHTQQVRTKSGLIEAYVVPPPVALYRDIARMEISRSLVEGPDHVAPAWQAALRALDIAEGGHDHDH